LLFGDFLAAKFGDDLEQRADDLDEQTGTVEKYIVAKNMAGFVDQSRASRVEPSEYSK
jgi:hypothetical protein